MNRPKAEVFHGKDLDRLVDQAIERCPSEYHVVDFKADYLNNEWIVVVKIEVNAKE